jgi:hypothetical protein
MNPVRVQDNSNDTGQYFCSKNKIQVNKMKGL